MISKPVILSFIAMFLWGIWTVFSKIATETLNSTTVMALNYLIGGGIAVIYLFWTGETSTLETTGVYYAIAGGVLAGLGGITYYLALSMGKTALVAPIGGLYFVVAAAIGILFLGESMSPLNIVGIGFAGLAVYLISL